MDGGDWWASFTVVPRVIMICRHAWEMSTGSHLMSKTRGQWGGKRCRVCWRDNFKLKLFPQVKQREAAIGRPRELAVLGGSERGDGCCDHNMTASKPADDFKWFGSPSTSRPTSVWARLYLLETTSLPLLSPLGRRPPPFIWSALAAALPEAYPANSVVTSQTGTWTDRDRQTDTADFTSRIDSPLLQAAPMRT